MQPRVPVVGSIQKESTQKKCTATVRLKHVLHQRRKNAASKSIPSVSSMLRIGPTEPRDYLSQQIGQE
jgi:hypothetical protein